MALAGSIHRLLLALLALSCSAPLVVACSCIEVPPSRAFEQSQVVFVGRVISREESPPTPVVGANGDTTWYRTSADMVRYEMVATEGWKGEPRDTITIYSEVSGASCGFGFQVGQTYLVYAYVMTEDWWQRAWPVGTTFPLYAASLCSRTGEFDRAAEDLAWLGPPAWLLSPTPAKLHLRQNQPNPFNPVTAITFELPRPGRATLRVFDTSGRLIRVLLDRDMPAGTFMRGWDGRDDAGHDVKSGVYFSELSSGALRETRRMTLVR